MVRGEARRSGRGEGERREERRGEEGREEERRGEERRGEKRRGGGKVRQDTSRERPSASVARIGAVCLATCCGRLGRDGADGSTGQTMELRCGVTAVCSSMMARRMLRCDGAVPGSYRSRRPVRVTLCVCRHIWPPLS